MNQIQMSSKEIFDFGLNSMFSNDEGDGTYNPKIYKIKNDHLAEKPKDFEIKTVVIANVTSIFFHLIDIVDLL